ncbi:MAG TPA: type II toxin-antitoxin system PemK/MazF family toxin [Gaiella sp.]|uniref:type II toxin-antitoxin system PemK/MazF family toxin n=1 Tax=Gaiella sp. TaxID=2663207 RepID=UPI002D80C533|nr:type II toxin-antitoxin system PemK/MazF family toxin [Gaiella sp.]HET9286739.1 type II toxin-antitoxin system PemK/MazF family toxin [Gaiella sp.]
MVRSTPRQGDVWWGEAEDERRPVLVVTRTEAVPVLDWIVVAPITRRIRAIRTEIRLGIDDGLSEECVASFDNLQTVPRSLLSERVSDGTAARRSQICRALAALADC